MHAYLDTLSTFAARTAFEEIPSAVQAAAKLIFLDTLGGMLAGSTLPEVQAFARLASGASPAQPCTVVGFEDGASAREAAMVNATAACSFETDEGTRFGGGHPAIHVLPSALARAESGRACGRELLRSLILGYEVMSRLAAGARPRWPVHSHGTHGSPGAAIAAVLCERPDPARVRRLINLAVCMTPATTWQACFDGATVRNLWPALSTQMGMLALDLERAGYAGSNNAPADIYGAILGDGYDGDLVIEGLGKAWRVSSNYFKLHFSCAYTHPALDAIFALLERRRFSADDVLRITVEGPQVARYLSGFWPSTMLAAKFSFPFALAAAIVRGSSGIESFLDDARSDPAIAELAGRVDVIADPARDPGGFGDRGRYRVAVQLRDGAVCCEEVQIARGDAANPVPESLILQKFHALASMRIAPDAAEHIAALVLHVDQLEDVAELGAALRRAAVSGPSDGEPSQR